MYYKKKNKSKTVPASSCESEPMKEIECKQLMYEVRLSYQLTFPQICSFDSYISKSMKICYSNKLLSTAFRQQQEREIQGWDAVCLPITP